MYKWTSHLIFTFLNKGTIHSFAHCEVMKRKSHDRHLHNTIYFLKVQVCNSEKSVDHENIILFISYLSSND